MTHLPLQTHSSLWSICKDLPSFMEKGNFSLLHCQTLSCFLFVDTAGNLLMCCCLRDQCELRAPESPVPAKQGGERQLLGWEQPLPAPSPGRCLPDPLTAENSSLMFVNTGREGWGGARSRRRTRCSSKPDRSTCDPLCRVNLVARSALLLPHPFSSSCLPPASTQSSVRALPDASLSPQLPHGHMALPSFWKVVEDSLQQSGAQLRAFCQAFETVAPSPGTQVGHSSGQLGTETLDCGFPVQEMPLVGRMAQDGAQGVPQDFPQAPESWG